MSSKNRQNPAIVLGFSLVFRFFYAETELADMNEQLCYAVS
jgi:hypothetical protein